VKRQYEILRDFAEAYGPSAAEGEVAAVIRATLGRKFEFHTTPHGNLLCWRKPSTSRRSGGRNRCTIMLQAHMDELAFRPFRYQPDGFIEVSPLSPLPDNVANHPIMFRPGNKEGLLIVTNEGNVKRYFLDVGANSADEARREVPYYAVGAYSSSFGFSTSEFTCKSFDDRAGCALIAEALLANADNGEALVVGVFTTREETGNWPHPELVRDLNALDLLPDLMVNLEVCPGGPSPEDPRPVAAVGNGVGLVHMDKFYAASSAICRFMVETAEHAEVPHQHVAMRVGGGEMGALAMQLGVRSYGFVIPGRYMHSPHSVISRHDFDAADAMVQAVIERFPAWMAE